MVPQDPDAPGPDGRTRRDTPVAARSWDRGSASGEGRAVAVPPRLGGIRGLYERYCDHEARALLALVPREGLRALYRAARDEAQDMDPPGGAHAPDTMALLVRHARRLLPLPPYEVWMRSYLADRRPFLEALGIASVPARPDPVLVDVRNMDDGWIAGLHLQRRPEGWRGFVRFQRDGTGVSCRTADIFHGDDPDELRRRFQEFHAATLQAFLRSVLA